MTNKTCLVLAGPSGLGKSTYIDKMMSLIDKPVHIYSTDVYIEEIAEQQASSYDKCWSPSAMHVAGKKADAALDEALQQGVDVIWDQTNLSVEKRAPYHQTNGTVLLHCTCCGICSSQIWTGSIQYLDGSFAKAVNQRRKIGP